MSPLAEDDFKLTIPAQFSQIVTGSPGQIAVQLDEDSLTYAELDRQSKYVVNFFANEFDDQQVPVPVLHSSQKQIVPLLIGIVNAGHMYCAISSNDPVERISNVLTDLDAPLLVVSDQNLLTLARKACPPKTRILLADDAAQRDYSSPVKVRLSADSHAVITYTSGSTGEPKGVLRTHKMILHQSWTYRDQFLIGAKSRMLGIRPYSVSSSLSELFGSLLNGATIVPFDLKEDGLGKLAHILKTQKISMLRPPIQVLRSFLDSLPDGETFPDIRHVFATGDVLYRNDVERLRKIIPVDAIIVHQLAMSEAGLLATNRITHDTILDSEVVPAGHPVKGKELIILDENGRELPQGEVGEICVRTKLAFPGYWRAETQTSNRFVPDPKDPAQKVFTTGDLGRLRADGQLELTGRKDWRVKILGFSVDLSAIEHKLMMNPDVQRAVVVAVPDHSEQKRLVAYVLPAPNTQPTSRELINSVASSLPSYMVPSLIMMISEMPLSAAGKVDRKLLPPPSWESIDLLTQYEAPRRSIESELLEIWKKILKIKQLGINDSFFELGGDSLMALEMTLDVERLTSKAVPQAFFKHPTISSLALLLVTDNHEKNKEKFVLGSYVKNSGLPRSKKKRKITASKLRKMATQKYLLADIDRLVNLSVARYIVSKPYLEAKAWAVKWSLNPLVQYFIYSRRHAFLSDLVSTFQAEQVLSSAQFQMSIITNLNYGLSRYYDKSKRDSLGKRAALGSSRFKYWQSLADLLENTPGDQLDSYFPINGWEHFMNAYDEGKGVILLTAHSISSPIRLYSVSRKINMEIPTISYRIPIRQSEYRDNPKGLPRSVGLTMNAEIAFFGQKLLQQGRAINIVGDTSDPYGQVYTIALGKRAYQIKSGFAELALNTGAKIIPHFGGCLADGRPELNFLPPLEPGHGDRDKKVENLVNQYASFINYVWSNHPQVLPWKRIKRHFSRPELHG